MAKKGGTPELPEPFDLFPPYFEYRFEGYEEDELLELVEEGEEDE